jgi:hypothetical protein
MLISLETVNQIRPYLSLRAQRIVLAVSCLLISASLAIAEEAPASGKEGQAQVGSAEKKTDKWQFTLLNPTPRDAMREFSPDRPDVTESPYTVDAGHFQFETSLFSYTRSHFREQQADLNRVLGFSNMKVGLLNNMDLEFLFDPYDNLLTRTRGNVVRTHGGGPMGLRLKTNLFGNDGGNVAVALLPAIFFPTGNDALSSDHVEGGFIVPVALKLPAGFDLGTEVAFDFVRNAANDGYGVDFAHTLTIGHNIIGKLAGYVEYVGVSPHRTGQTYAPSIGTGLIYALTKDIELDTGVNVGLAESAPDFNVYVGLTFRI